MNGLKASSAGKLSLPAFKLQIVGASKCLNEDKCDNEEGSSDGAGASETYDECDGLPSRTESDGPSSNDGHKEANLKSEGLNDAEMDYYEFDSLPSSSWAEDDGPTSSYQDEKIQEIPPVEAEVEELEADRDVVAFFEQFVPNPSPSGTSKPQPQQPIAILQSRYNTVQHQLDKQAKHKSTKGWFRGQSRGMPNDSWKTSDIVIPDDIATIWGLNAVHSSGQFQLTKSELEMLNKEHDGRDILLDLCGEYRIISSADDSIEFKSKKGAQKSAALNLLLSMDLGDAHSNNKLKGNSGQPAPSCNEPIQGVLPKERFQLVDIRYYYTVKDSEGVFLSSSNPCMVKCIVSAKDLTCNDLNQTVVEMKSGFHENEDASLDAALGELRYTLMARGATDDDVNNVLSAINEKQPIPCEYEMTLPRWSTAKMEEQLYLYEMEFSWCKEGSDSCIPLSKAMNLDVNAATRIGVLLGCDLYEAQKEFEKELSADFTLGTAGGTNGSLRVRMCTRTKLTQTDMTEQIQRASPNINLEKGEDPISLARCFNSILLDNGKSYGLGPPPVWEDLLKRLDEDKPEACSRTYLFLPLCYKVNCSKATDLQIDWRLVWDAVHHKSSAVLYPTVHVRAGPSLAASMVCALCILFSVTRSYSWGNLLQIMHWTSIPMLLLPLVAVGVSTLTYKPKRMPTSLLCNRFLAQPVGFGGRVFIAKNEEVPSVTSLSPLLPQDISSQIPDSLKVRLLESHGRLHISHATYYEQFRKCSMRYPKEPLVQAISMIGLSYSQHELTLFHQLYETTLTNSIFDPSSQISISNVLAGLGLLVPELTLALPMPRDMVYVCQYASEFMTKLERSHTLRVVASRMRELQSDAAILLQYENCIPASTDKMIQLIDKATSLNNNTNNKATVREHERLETLGDSVLLLFIVMNLFAKHPSSNIQYVLDLFEEVINLQGKNKVLFQKACDIGLYQLIHVGNQSSSKAWSSAYKTSANKGSLAPFAHTTEIARKQMSDVVESLLGATYLADQSGCMSAGLLNEIESCLLTVEDETLHNTPYSNAWFAGRGTCLTEGYPFNGHCEWANELTKLRCILQSKHDVLSVLQKKATRFYQILSKQTTHQNQVERLQSNQTASLLLHCALFDDSLDGKDSNLESSSLESFAKLRDKIFHVGNAALQLSIVSEIYHLFPESTSGDFQLMKVTLLSQDSLAYILVKNGIHECLFDSEADAIIMMQGYMNESDLLGAEDWAKNANWVLPGGTEEFCRRIQRLHNNCSQPIMECPQYVGLAAGRLRGQQDKLPDSASEDLQFSMKCIVGALVLAFGVEDAWQNMLRPFFLELLMLSPDELRIAYNDVSPLASCYQKGRR